MTYNVFSGTLNPTQSQSPEVFFRATLRILVLRCCAAASTGRWHHFQGDIIAGITVGLTVVPQSLAYANIAELPPQVCGLYTQPVLSTRGVPKGV